MMAGVIPNSSAVDVEAMHTHYREGGAQRMMAPDVVDDEAACSHLGGQQNVGCQQNVEAIDFRWEAFGRAIDDRLMRAGRDDVDFAGQRPGCHGWIHFTIRGKLAMDEQAAPSLPQLPANWADEAVIL